MRTPLITTLALVLALLVSSPPAMACGERGGPGCRLPNGKCAGWAQVNKCSAPPADAPKKGKPGKK